MCCSFFFLLGKKTPPQFFIFIFGGRGFKHIALISITQKRGAFHRAPHNLKGPLSLSLSLFYCARRRRRRRRRQKKKKRRLPRGRKRRRRRRHHGVRRRVRRELERPAIAVWPSACVAVWRRIQQSRRRWRRTVWSTTVERRKRWWVRTAATNDPGRGVRAAAATAGVARDECVSRCRFDSRF